MKTVLLNILLATPVGLGWLVGFIVRACRVTWAAVVEGFMRGNKL